MDVIYRYDPFAPIVPREIPDAAAAIDRLIQGNQRFSDMVHAIQRRTLGEGPEDPLILPLCPISLGLPLYQGAVLNQAPFALILGCSDARVPTELVFDQWLNDLFVLRVAGNVLGTACLGSLHYAARHLGDSLQLVVVLGHAKCGAVQAAVATYLSPQNFSDIAYTFALRTLVDQIQIAIRGSAHALRDVAGSAISQDPDYQSLLVTTSVYVNAAVSALELRRELDQRGFKQPVVTGVYEFETLSVQALPGDPISGTLSTDRLRPGPSNPEELSHYANEVARAALTALERNRANGNS
ncbi:MAG: carbonic anhydrase [Planctomycetaceae bacterium]|jgi:carbonic anhydrase